MKNKSLMILLLISMGGISQPTEPTALDEFSDKRPDVSLIKAKHYRKNGFRVLPTFFTDTVIGPGNFVGIDDVIIRNGTILRIRPGTTLMFEPGAKCIVEGRLI
ncbi:MAG: hypothetical protein GF344_18070, partial [Chitinivibrionales bacterium]|nr:hypothetical protein [Chitinivibrionales bacterium]MBD3358564.1 hypothetical protein [Chitinivibrionales bacterium]